MGIRPSAGLVIANAIAEVSLDGFLEVARATGHRVATARGGRRRSLAPVSPDVFPHEFRLCSESCWTGVSLE